LRHSNTIGNYFLKTQVGTVIYMNNLRKNTHQLPC